MSIQNDNLISIIRSYLCLPEDDKDYEIHFSRFINGNETVNSFCMNNTTDNRVVKKNSAFYFMDDNFMDKVYDNFFTLLSDQKPDEGDEELLYHYSSQRYFCYYKDFGKLYRPF